MNLGKKWEFDAFLRYVDSTPHISVPSYWSLDLRLAWQITPTLELSAVGQNLLQSQHAEFTPTTIKTQPTEVERSFYVKLSWEF